MTARKGAIGLYATILLILEARILAVDGTTVTVTTTTRASTNLTTAVTPVVSNCGGSINGSGILTSPNYPYFYHNNALCRWRISASPGNGLQLQASLLDLESGFDFLMINTTYKNKISMGEMRYSGVVVNFSLILGEYADVLFVSDQSITGTGFTVNVSSVSAIIPRAVPFEDCGGNITRFGAIVSPNHPNPYPNNAKCHWHFEATRGSFVAVSVSYLSLERGYDNLTVTSTSSYSSGSNQALDVRSIYESRSGTVILPSNAVVFVFESDSTVQNQGFYIYVSSFDNSSHVESTTYSYLSNSTQYACGGNITDPENFTSPNYPNDYPNWAQCRWFIQAPQGKLIHIFIPRFALEQSYDFLIFNSTYPNKSIPDIRTFTGNVWTNFTVVLGLESYVSFTSDGSIQRTGFSATVTFVDAPPYDSSSFNACGGNLTGEGLISSPNYPNFYPNNANCRWYLQAYQNQIVNIYIYAIDTEQFYDEIVLSGVTAGAALKNDTIDMAKLYGTGYRLISFPKNSAFLHFRSDSNVQHTGFNLYFSSAMNSSNPWSTTPWPSAQPTAAFYECGGNITGQGNFTSPFFPGLYPSMATCIWYLKAASGKVLQIDAPKIDLEERYDFLVFNTTYANKTTPESFRFTGYRTNVTLILASEAYVIFQSDFSVEKTGFRVFVSSVTPPHGFDNFYRECNTTITAPGTLLSPDYPSQYPLEVDCQWTIRAPAGRVVKLQFIEFSTIPLFDVLRIFQEENVTCGTQFTMYSGSSVNGSIVFGRAIVVAFSSSSPIRAAGFRLLVSFINPAATVRSSLTTTTALPIASCGAIISGAGRLRSPNYPSPYKPNTRCVWKLNRRAKWPCTLRINSLRLESPWDTMRVYLTGTPGANDVPAAEYTGSINGLTASFNTTILTIIFESDESVQLAGFDISFYSNASSPRPTPLMKAVLPKPGDCGVPALLPPATSGSERIVGGTSAQPGAWPWQAMIYYFDRFICGGSLIAPQWVLTAGHCILSSSPSSFNVSLGKHYTTGSYTTEQRFSAVKVIRHPAYDSASDNSDLALIKLPRPVTFTAAIKPVCLPITDVPPGSICYISGWGDTKGTGNATVLRQAAIPALSRQCCKNFLGDAFSKNMSCAGYLKGGKDTCQGDSGGPFVCKLNGIFWLHGITSWGVGCGRPYYPGVYTRVPSFMKWITEAISLN